MKKGCHEIHFGGGDHKWMQFLEESEAEVLGMTYRPCVC